MVSMAGSKTRLMAMGLSATDAFEAGFLTNIYTNQTAEVHELAYSRDGKRMVLGMDDELGDIKRHVVIIDFPNENLYGIDSEGLNILKLTGHNNSIYSVQFSSSGRQVASAGKDNTIKIWDAINGGQPLSTFEEHKGDVYTLSYNPAREDRLASGDRFGVIYVWDPTKKADENPILNLEGHRAEVKSIRYSPDGTRLVSGSYDYSVMLWDAVNGGPAIIKFVGHQAGINSVSYRPDGQRIASCSNDGTVKIWDVSNLASNSPITSQKIVTTITVHDETGDNECEQVEYSPDGKLIATEGNGNTIKIWNVEEEDNRYAQLMWALTDISSQDLSFHPNGNAIAFDHDDKAAVWIFQPPTPSPSVMSSYEQTSFPSEMPTSSPVLPVSSPVFLPVRQPMSQPVLSPQAIVNGVPHHSLSDAVDNRGLGWKLSIGLGVPFIVIGLLLLIYENNSSNEKEKQQAPTHESSQNSIC